MAAETKRETPIPRAAARAQNRLTEAAPLPKSGP